MAKFMPLAVLDGEFVNTKYHRKLKASTHSSTLPVAELS